MDLLLDLRSKNSSHPNAANLLKTARMIRLWRRKETEIAVADKIE